MATKDTQTKLKNFTPDPDITTEALEEMRLVVLDRIITARIGLLLRHPFFGNMATRLRLLQQMSGLVLLPLMVVTCTTTHNSLMR
jgi:hypothetical protein